MRLDFFCGIFTIFFVAVVYGLFIQFGPLGYGIDVHQSYQYAADWTWGFEPIGWFIASLKVEISGTEYYIGSSMVSFLLALGFLQFSFTILEKRFGLFLSLIVSIFLLFSHAIILNGTNVLRQGLALSFLFMFWSQIIQGRKIRSWLFAAASILSHNSVLLIMAPFFIIFYVNIRYFRVSAVVLYLLLLYFFAGIISSTKSSIATNTDYRPILGVMLFCAVSLFLIFYNKYKKRYFSTTELLFEKSLILCLVSFIVFFDLPSVLQRLLMLILIPLILYLILAIPINRKFKIFILILISLLWSIITLSSSALTTWQPL